MPNKFGSIRNEVVSILNGLIGKDSDQILFTPENTFKKGGANPNKNIYKENISVNWYARAEELEDKKLIWVDCIGMTMTDFIKEYSLGNVIITKSSMEKIDQYTLYKNSTMLKAYGYVESLDTENKSINLFLSERIELVKIPITDKTPKWLFSKNKYIGFRCRIYLYWRGLRKEDIENADWDPVWKTFKFERELFESELENFPSIFYY